MTTKGKRNERHCREIYETAGFAAYSPQESKWGETDIYNLFDVLAVDPTGCHRVHLVQVKTNAARGIQTWVQDAARFATPHTRPLMAVRHDRDGWRVLGVDDAQDGYTTLCDGREHDATIGQAYLQWLQSSDSGDHDA